MKWNSVRVRLSLWNIGILAVGLVSLGLAMGCAVEANVSAEVNRELSNRIRGMEAGRPGFGPGGPHHHGRDVLMGPPAPGKPFGRDRGPDHGHGPGRDRGPDDRFHEGPPPWFTSLSAEERRVISLGRPHFLDLDGKDHGPDGPTEAWDKETFLASLAGARRYSTRVVDGHRLRILSAPVQREGKVVGVVQVAHELSELERLHKGLLATMLVVIPLALLVAGSGGLFLTDRALRPVRAVTQAAAEISVQDLSRRLVVKGKDELAELAATFNGMLARLEEAFRQQERSNEQLRRFTADVSHELRTPLARLKGITSLTLSMPRGAAAYEEALTVADQAADAMTRLVQDLLLLARSDSGQLRLATRPTEIASVLQDAVEAVPAPESLKIRRELPTEPLVIQSDPTHLTRLFVNVLDNAIRHTPPDGAITISAWAQNGHVCASIRDTGSGIPPEHLDHIFERFYRVDDARDRTRGGTGLGLAICKSIAEAHGGELRVESEPGQGAVVTVELPRVRSGAETSS